MPLTRSGLWVPPRGTPSRQYRNPERGTHDAQGRAYGICPMCSRKANVVVSRTAEDTIHECEACGYRDSDEHGALN